MTLEVFVRLCGGEPFNGQRTDVINYKLQRTVETITLPTNRLNLFYVGRLTQKLKELVLTRHFH